MDALGNIFTVLLDMPNCIKGHVNSNKDGTYTVFINSRLAYEEQQRVYRHELSHLYSGDFERHNVDLIEEESHKRIYEEINML